MLFSPVSIQNFDVSSKDFWSAILVYNDRPHLVNSRIVTSISSNLYKISNSEKIIEYFKLNNSSLPFESIKDTIVEQIDILESDWSEFHDNYGIFLSFRSLIGRNISEKCSEIVIFNKTKGCVTFLPIHPNLQSTIAPRCFYEFQIIEGGLQAATTTDKQSENDFIVKVFKKIVKWAQNDVNGATIIQSLSFIDVPRYYEINSRLKSKYVDFLIKADDPQSSKIPNKKNTFRLSGAGKKRYKWLVSHGCDADEARALAVFPIDKHAYLLAHNLIKESALHTNQNRELTEEKQQTRNLEQVPQRPSLERRQQSHSLERNRLSRSSERRRDSRSLERRLGSRNSERRRESRSSERRYHGETIAERYVRELSRRRNLSIDRDRERRPRSREKYWRDDERQRYERSRSRDRRSRSIDRRYGFGRRSHSRENDDRWRHRPDELYGNPDDTLNQIHQLTQELEREKRIIQEYTQTFSRFSPPRYEPNQNIPSTSWGQSTSTSTNYYDPRKNESNLPNSNYFTYQTFDSNPKNESNVQNSGYQTFDSNTKIESNVRYSNYQTFTIDSKPESNLQYSTYQTFNSTPKNESNPRGSNYQTINSNPDNGFWKTDIASTSTTAWSDPSDSQPKLKISTIDLCESESEMNESPLGKNRFKIYERIAIVPFNYPTTTLTKSQFNELEKLILDKVITHNKGPNRLIFNGCSYNKTGFMVICCLDKYTADWLKFNIPHMKPYPGANLIVTNPSNIPRQKREKFVGFFPNSGEDSTEKIFNYLETQNPGISTRQWILIKRTNLERNAVHLVFNVDYESAVKIRNLSCKLNYKFKPIRLKCKAKPGETPESTIVSPSG